MLYRSLLLLAFATVSPRGHGEERFYPVIGPDGSVRVIRSEVPRDAPAAAREGGSPIPAASVPPTSGAADVRGEGAPAAAATPLPYADYDSDNYVDSEAMDAATLPAEVGRKRFYLLRDGLGEHVTEADAGGDVLEALASLPPGAAESATWELLLGDGLSWDAGQAQAAMPWLPACPGANGLSDWPPLGGGKGRAVVVGRKDGSFLGSDRIHSGWRLPGEGPRTLQVYSYGRSRKRPVFMEPRLLFMDGRGCITRVLQGWFSRRYAANDRRHEFLRAELVVHSGEEAVALLLPPEQDRLAAAAPWQASRWGQLKFILKK